MKEFDKQLLKFQITDNDLIMKISLEDLVWLFENSPSNSYDGKSVGVKVKPDKVQQFAEFIVEQLMDESRDDSGDAKWGVPFEEAFLEIIEGYEPDMCEYTNDDEFDEDMEDAE